MHDLDSHDLDLAAYLTRISYRGPIAPTLPVLKSLHAHHSTAIPFENLTPFSNAGKGRAAAPNLTVRGLEEKIVRSGRGGYCFEQNRLFCAALLAVGFDVRPVLARVLFGNEGVGPTALNHLLLVVRIRDACPNDNGTNGINSSNGTNGANDTDGSNTEHSYTYYTADVGFGGPGQTGPLRLDLAHPGEQEEQNTPHGRYRFVRTAARAAPTICLDSGWPAAVADGWALEVRTGAGAGTGTGTGAGAGAGTGNGDGNAEVSTGSGTANGDSTEALGDGGHGDTATNGQAPPTSNPAWLRLYRFTLAPVEWVDCGNGNWWCATSPDSPFVDDVMAAAVFGEDLVSRDTGRRDSDSTTTTPNHWPRPPLGRASLFNAALTIRDSSGVAIYKEQIESAETWAAALRHVVGVEMGSFDVDALWARLRRG